MNLDGRRKVDEYLPRPHMDRLGSREITSTKAQMSPSYGEW